MIWNDSNHVEFSAHQQHDSFKVEMDKIIQDTHEHVHTRLLYRGFEKRQY